MHRSPKFFDIVQEFYEAVSERTRVAIHRAVTVLLYEEQLLVMYERKHSTGPQQEVPACVERTMRCWSKTSFVVPVMWVNVRI